MRSGRSVKSTFLPLFYYGNLFPACRKNYRVDADCFDGRGLGEGQAVEIGKQLYALGHCALPDQPVRHDSRFSDGQYAADYRRAEAFRHAGGVFPCGIDCFGQVV